MAHDKKVQNNHSVAFDHLTVVQSEASLRSKTANLSNAKAQLNLKRATTALNNAKPAIKPSPSGKVEEQ